MARFCLEREEEWSNLLLYRSNLAQFFTDLVLVLPAHNMDRCEPAPYSTHTTNGNDENSFLER